MKSLSRTLIDTIDATKSDDLEKLTPYQLSTLMDYFEPEFNKIQNSPNRYYLVTRTRKPSGTDVDKIIVMSSDGKIKSHCEKRSRYSKWFSYKPDHPASFEEFLKHASNGTREEFFKSIS